MNSSEKDSDSGPSDVEENFDDARGDFPLGGSRVKPEDKDEVSTEQSLLERQEIDGIEEYDVSQQIEVQEENVPILNIHTNLSQKNHLLRGLQLFEDLDKTTDMSKYFYAIGKENIIVYAQEPWPKDVKLFQPYEIEQILLPDNANCLAVQAFLKMCNLEFQIESRSNAEYMSPSGKVPFIKCGAFVVSELEGIVTFVNQKGISLSSNLEPEQKSDLRAYIALINNVLGNAESYVCWCDPETYRDVTKPRNGSVYPWPLNLIQTWNKRSKELKRLRTLGWCDKTLEEVFQEVETCCQALTDRLENNTYFFGNKPTELDALVFGHLFTILTTPLPNLELANTVRKFPSLINLVKKVEKDYFKRESEH